MALQDAAELFQQTGRGEIDADGTPDYVEVAIVASDELRVRHGVSSSPAAGDFGCLVIQAFEVPSGRFLIAQGL